MSEFEKAITEAQGGKFRLMARKIANLKKSMDDSINAQLFSDGTGNSSKDMGGLQHIVASSPSTGTVGNINRASFTFWRNQQNSGAQTSTAYDNLQSALRTTYNDCSNGVGQQNPDFGIMTQTDFEGYEGLLDNNERYVREGVNDMGVSGFKGQKLMFKDIPMAYDDDCPSATAYILNNRNLKLVYARWMRMFDAVNPANQFIEVPKVLTIANLVSDNPRRLGAVTSIS